MKSVAILCVFVASAWAMGEMAEEEPIINVLPVVGNAPHGRCVGWGPSNQGQAKRIGCVNWHKRDLTFVAGLSIQPVAIAPTTPRSMLTGLGLYSGNGCKIRLGVYDNELNLLTQTAIMQLDSTWGYYVLPVPAGGIEIANGTYYIGFLRSLPGAKNCYFPSEDIEDLDEALYQTALKPVTSFPQPLITKEFTASTYSYPVWMHSTAINNTKVD